MESTKVRRDVDQIILDSFWNLSDVKKHIRISSACSIICTLHKKQENFSKVSDEVKCKELIYSLERLVKGMCSSHNAARQGYVLVLTEVLKLFCEVSIEELLLLVEKHLPLTNKHEKSPMVIGQLLVFSAVIRSGRLACDVKSLPLIINTLHQLSSERNYMQLASYTLMLDIFSQITETTFKEYIWTELKKELSCGWEVCTPYIMCLLLACQRMFPNAISSKFLKKNWGDEDIFCEKNLDFFKIIMNKSTVVHPQFHPLFSELLLCLIESKAFKRIWRIIIDGNLFARGQNEKAYLGFRMVKEVLTQKSYVEKFTGSNLNDSHNNKMVKYILSSNFFSVFVKSLINLNHPLHSVAEEMAGILCCFVKNATNTKIEMIVLKGFLKASESTSLPQILNRKELRTMIRHLSPESVKAYLEMMKSEALGTKQNENGENDSCLNQQRCTAALQIGTLVSHTATICDIEWRIEIIKFLFLHSFFTIQEPTDDIPHCNLVIDLLPNSVRHAFRNAFAIALDSLYRKVDRGITLSQQLCSLLLSVVDYAQKLLHSPEYVTPIVLVEKLTESWNMMYNRVQKLNERRKKKKNENMCSAFQILFLHLGLELYSDPKHIPSILEELHVCYKKARKTKEVINEKENKNEPSWIQVLVDVMLSLLSQNSDHLCCGVELVFPLICSFMTPESLQQILDVIVPEKTSEAVLLVDDTEEMEFDTGSSSDEDEQENNMDDITEVSDIKLKLHKVLDSTVDASEAKSDVVLNNTEMFKLDDALPDTFRSRKKVGHTQPNTEQQILLKFGKYFSTKRSRKIVGHTQPNTEQKVLLKFRFGCLNLIGTYLKSEPPMYLVIKCIFPILSALEFGLQSQHQRSLTYKAKSVIQILVNVKKFQHYEKIHDTEMDDILQELFRKANKEKNVTLQGALCLLCMYMVLCKRKLCLLPGNEEKFKLTNSFKLFFVALNDFMKQDCHITPKMFTSLMAAFPEKAWEFLQPLQEYAFDEKIDLLKQAHCLDLLVSALRYSKAQKSISSSVWLESLKMLMSKAAESAKNVFGHHSNIEPAYTTPLLDVIVTIIEIYKEKCNETRIEGHQDLIPLLESAGNTLNKRSDTEGYELKKKILLRGQVPNAKLTSNKKRKFSE